jgi:hypothetical protein
MPNVTVHISTQRNILNEIDTEAKRESRSRSELLREAAPLYIRRQKKWDQLFRLGNDITRRRDLKQSDVATQVGPVYEHRTRPHRNHRS